MNEEFKITVNIGTKGEIHLESRNCKLRGSTTKDNFLDKQLNY